MNKLNPHKNIYTTLNAFVEAYVDKEGNIRDLDMSPSSDMLWTDREFIEIISDNLENVEEMPEEMYAIISDNHKTKWE